MPSVPGTVVGQNTNRCEGQTHETATAQLRVVIAATLATQVLT